jgi:predicted DNA-binding transcriptional regulator AlpA
MKEENIFRSPEIELFTRNEVAKLLKIAISHVDMIPESDLPRVHIGKSIRFRLSTIKNFIESKETKIQVSIN